MAHTERVEAGIDVNSYFASHPDMVLGELAATTNAYGRADSECRPKPGTDLEEALREALGKMTARIPNGMRPKASPATPSPQTRTCATGPTPNLAAPSTSAWVPSCTGRIPRRRPLSESGE